jgi:hypothetical protein
MTDPPADRSKRKPVTRIDEDSATFKWVVPVGLILLGLIMVGLFLASIAVLLDVFPKG